MRCRQQRCLRGWPCDGVVAILADGSFRIGRKVGRDGAKIAFFKQCLAGAFVGNQLWRVLLLVVFRVAPHSTADGTHQMLSLAHALRRGLKFTRGQRALLRADYRPPTHGKGYGQSCEYQDSKSSIDENSYKNSSPTLGRVSSP
jgi:hypothetical protein